MQLKFREWLESRADEGWKKTAATVGLSLLAGLGGTYAGSKAVQQSRGQPQAQVRPVGAVSMPNMHKSDTVVNHFGAGNDMRTDAGLPQVRNGGRNNDAGVSFMDMNDDPVKWCLMKGWRNEAQNMERTEAAAKSYNPEETVRLAALEEEALRRRFSSDREDQDFRTFYLTRLRKIDGYKAHAGEESRRRKEFGASDRVY